MEQSAIPARLEEDALGTRLIPDDLAYGIQTERAVDNFSISGRVIADIEGFVASSPGPAGARHKGKAN
jgi:aspartate ammonia-lyase